MDKTISFRKAVKKDALDILRLFYEVYLGKYPDPMFSDFNACEMMLESTDHFVFVAEMDRELVATVHFQYDEKNLFAKAGAAVVKEKIRGHNTTQKLLKHGIEFLEDNTRGLELVYVTTRTINKAAQILTEKLGFKKLGIFPNVHKTVDYETHALGAYFNQKAFDKRFKDFELHPKLKKLADIALTECGEKPLLSISTWNEKVYNAPLPPLELIEATHFAQYQFNDQSKKECLDFAFFPFLRPNALITSPDQSIQIFFNINSQDKHCVVIGLKIDRTIGVDTLLLKMCSMLRDVGVRYIEMISRSHRLNIIDKIIRAKFVPCGYIPGFQLENEIRYDYTVFSRSFEVLDFSNLALTGTYAKYLKEYMRLWEEIAFSDELKTKES